MFLEVTKMMFQVKVVKDIWTEEDEGGKVRFATVQVHNLEYHQQSNELSCRIYSKLRSAFLQRS